MSTQVIPSNEVFQLLGALVESRRAAFQRRCTIAFAVVDDSAYFVDTSAPKVVEKVWRKDADISVLCNQRTLSDLIAGRFDVQNPAPEHLFVWGGDHDVWAAFARAFTGATSKLGAQLQSLLSRKSRGVQ